MIILFFINWIAYLDWGGTRSECSQSKRFTKTIFTRMIILFLNNELLTLIEEVRKLLFADENDLQKHFLLQTKYKQSYNKTKVCLWYYIIMFLSECCNFLTRMLGTFYSSFSIIFGNPSSESTCLQEIYLSTSIPRPQKL